MGTVNQQTKAQKAQAIFQSKTFNIGMGGLDFAMTYADRRKTNPQENAMVSAGYAGVSAAAWYFLPGIMWGKTALDVAKGAGEMAYNYKRQAYENQFVTNENRGVIGGNFVDNEFNYTSRQRGLQAIQSSRLNARSALANEARSLHRF